MTIYRNVEDARRATFGPRPSKPEPFAYEGKRLCDIPRDSALGRRFYEAFRCFADELPPTWQPGDGPPRKPGVVARVRGLIARGKRR